MSRDRAKVVENNINWGFLGWENSFSQSLTALPAPSGEGAFGKEVKLYRTAKGPISEGSVIEGDWRSKLPLSGELASLCEAERVFS